LRKKKKKFPRKNKKREDAIVFESLFEANPTTFSILTEANLHKETTPPLIVKNKKKFHFVYKRSTRKYYNESKDFRLFFFKLKKNAYQHLTLKPRGMFAGPTSFEYSARQKLKNKIDGERLQKALASVSDWLWQQKVAKLTKKEKKAFKKIRRKQASVTYRAPYLLKARYLDPYISLRFLRAYGKFLLFGQLWKHTPRAIIRAANIEYKKELKKKKYPQSEETEGKLQGKLFKLEKLLFQRNINQIKKLYLTEIPQLATFPEGINRLASLDLRFFLLFLKRFKKFRNRRMRILFLTTPTSFSPWLFSDFTNIYAYYKRKRLTRAKDAFFEENWKKYESELTFRFFK